MQTLVVSARDIVADVRRGVRQPRSNAGETDSKRRERQFSQRSESFGAHLGRVRHRKGPVSVGVRARRGECGVGVGPAGRFTLRRQATAASRRFRRADQERREPQRSVTHATTQLSSVCRIRRQRAADEDVLIDKGVDVNAAGKIREWTPLMIAAGVNDLDAVRLLISKGADANKVTAEHQDGTVKNGPISTGHGDGVLMYAAPHGSTRVLIQALLSAKADPNAKRRSRDDSAHAGSGVGTAEPGGGQTIARRRCGFKAQRTRTARRLETGPGSSEDLRQCGC